MNEREALIQTILNNPNDDAARLVYADWMEENGQTDEAELIRVQIELAKPYRCPDQERMGICLWCRLTTEVTGITPSKYQQCRLRCKLRYREMRLREEWANRQVQKGMSWKGVVWDRGFIKSFECTIETIIDNLNETEYPLEDLFRWHPIESVAIIGRRPSRQIYSGQPEFSWFLYSRYEDINYQIIVENVIPRFLGSSRIDSGTHPDNRDLLISFRSETEAQNWLDISAFEYLARFAPLLLQRERHASFFNISSSPT